MRKYFIYISLVFMLGIIVIACKKETLRIEPDHPANPYDGVDYGQNPELIPVDSTSFLGLQTYTFKTTCAVPGCHDGSFEPDFRTVQSSYNSLVYHPVLKNDSAKTFEYRVLPGDTGLSWLHERITTDDAILGRMPLYDYLTINERENIATWILSGAKDIFDKSPEYPDMQPSMFGLLAYLNDTNGIRLDTNRDDLISPIKLPQNSNVQFWYGLFDTDVDGNFIPAYNFTDNSLKISNNPYDFSGSSKLPLTVEGALTPFMGPNPFTTSQVAPYYHSYKINTANFPVGQTQYMRVYVKDADHSFSTEIPEDGSQFYLLTYFSFIVL